MKSLQGLRLRAIASIVAFALLGGFLVVSASSANASSLKTVATYADSDERRFAASPAYGEAATTRWVSIFSQTDSGGRDITELSSVMFDSWESPEYYVSTNLAGVKYIRAKVPEAMASLFALSTVRIHLKFKDSPKTHTLSFVLGPDISDVTPTIGVEGTNVRISFKNRWQAPHIERVYFDGTPVPVKKRDDMAIEVTAPAHSAGAADLALEFRSQGVNEGLLQMPLDRSFTYAAKPTVTVVSPTAGPTAGGTVVKLTGTGLGSVTEVTFGGVAGTSLSATATSLTVTTPPGTAGEKAIALRSPGGNVTLTQKFTYAAQPIISTPTGDKPSVQRPLYTGTAEPSALLSLEVRDDKNVGILSLETFAAGDGSWTAWHPEVLPAGRYIVVIRDQYGQSSAILLTVIESPLAEIGIVPVARPVSILPEG